MPNYFAPDPSICHFCRRGWYERFKEVSQQAHKAFLDSHPELVASAEPASQVDEEKDGKPFSNC